jgi:hypothetical protein
MDQNIDWPSNIQALLYRCTLRRIAEDDPRACKPDGLALEC